MIPSRSASRWFSHVLFREEPLKTIANAAATDAMAIIAACPIWRSRSDGLRRDKDNAMPRTAIHGLPFPVGSTGKEPERINSR